MHTSPQGRQNWLVLGICLLTLTACSTTGTRVPPEAAVDLGGRWNDADSRSTAEAMIKDALGRPWPQRFSQLTGRTPVVVVGTVQNRTHEQLNTQTFVKDLERALMQSGTVKPLGQGSGADFMLQGTINSLVDELDSTRAVFYQVDLELIDVASNVRVWQGQRRVKKVVEPNKTAP